MALLWHYLVEGHDDNLGVVYFKNCSPQGIPWLWIPYVAAPNPLECMPVRYVVAYNLWTEDNGCFAKWNDSKCLLCRCNINVFGRLLSLAKMRFVLTSRDCNECIAENRAAFVYELLMGGNDKLCVFEPLYTE